MNTNLVRDWTRGLCVAAVIAVAQGCATTRDLATFETPDQAMNALADLVGTHDAQRTQELLGKDGAEFLRSGDDVADRADAERFQKAVRSKLAFEDFDTKTKVALVGVEAWPFPIPLVREGERWRFDAEAGVEEIANRRIGRNEIWTIATLHAYVDAQREYASAGPDDREPKFAQRVFSTPGQHDGLYWPAARGEPESPLGPLVAAAADAGYSRSGTSQDAFHGYRFRTLTSQGKNAPGGAKNFVDEKGAMTRGFGMLAWPAKYGNSGVMTFVVGPYGIVYQKDLGADTSSAAERITSFDPDKSWDPTGD